MGFCFYSTKAQSVTGFFKKHHDKDLSYKIALELDSVLKSPFIIEDTSFETTVNSLILRGDIKTELGNTPEAISLLYKAMNLLDTTSLTHLKCLAYHRTSRVFHKMGDLSSSIKYNRLAVDLSKENKDENYTKYLGDYAMLLAENGSIDSAKLFWTEIIKFHATTEPKPKIFFNTLSNLAVLSEWNEEYKTARNYYKLTLEYYKKTNDYGIITQCYINIGGNFADCEQYDSARFYFIKAQITNDSIKSLPNALLIVENLSLLSESTKDFQEARKWEKKRFKLNDSLKSTEALVQIGTIEEKYKNKIEEDRAFRKAEELKVKAERQADIQFFGIFLGIVFLFIMVFAVGFVKITIPLWLANSIVFFAFVLLFEFLLVLLDPTIDR